MRGHPLLLLLLLLLPVAGEGAGAPCGPRASIPCGANPKDDCAIRQLALQYAKELLPDIPDAAQLTSDALQLSLYCNTSHIASRPKSTRRTMPHLARSAVYVDPTNGNDANPGTLSSPFATIARAVKAAKEKSAAQIVLRGGVHVVTETIVVDASLSGVSFTGYPGEHPIVGSGVKISGLQWERTAIPGVESKTPVYVTTLPRNAPVPDQLFVGGQREVRAKYPNGDPALYGLYSTPTGMIPTAQWTHDSTKFRPSSREVTVSLTSPASMRDSPYFSGFKMSFGGSCERYSTNSSFWGGTVRPTSLTYSESVTNKTFNWANASTAIVHAFHGSHWGGWMFRVMSHDSKTRTIELDPFGGQQEARGKATGAEWYVENVLEELDDPREWFFDETTSKLYYAPNGTAPPSEVVIPSLRTVFAVKGSQAAPVTSVAFSNLHFTHSRTTFLEGYEVPSGGDWSIHRGGAVFVEGAEGTVFDSCRFDQMGGNAIFLSNYVRGTVVQGCHFSWIGDNAIAAVGSTRFASTHNMDPTSLDLADGTDGNHPEGTVVQKNLFRETGVYGKQTSSYFQSLACKTTIRENVMFNSPRAAINFNDGFGGGNVVERNLMFNHVRETGDHGNFNSWDRLPYYTNTTGRASTHVLENVMAKNFVISNYDSTWPLDHDDGSCFYHDHHNYLIYAGAKNFLGRAKRSEDNVYISVHLNGFFACAVDDSKNASDIYANNICTTATGLIYHDICNPSNLNGTVDVAYNNTYYTGTPILRKCGKESWTLAEYQKEGYEVGSTEHHGLPSTDQIVAWGKTVLGL